MGLDALEVIRNQFSPQSWSLGCEVVGAVKLELSNFFANALRKGEKQ
jgi:hypothetical protein